MLKFGVVLLAAGNSSRMGSPKQLLEYKGKPLVRHASEVALASHASLVIVVLGANSDAVHTAISDLAVMTVENERWPEGMGTSIRAGIEVAQQCQLDGVILALADQPLITPATFDRLIAHHIVAGKKIVASRYAGTVGVPVLFDKQYFANLLALTPDQGCKGLIQRYAEPEGLLDCPEAEIDIDTPEDYQFVRAGPASLK